VLGALADLGVIASGVYDLVAHQHAPQVWTAIRSVAFIVFLVFYVRRSRFAWHTLGVIIVCVIPLEVLLTPIDPGLKFRAPQLIWIHVGFLCWGLLLVLKCRRPYFLFIEAKARHDSA
jgi:membrane protein required for beta-lactamase induction